MPPSANPIRAAIATALRVTFKDSATISISCGLRRKICCKAARKASERSSIWVTSADSGNLGLVRPEIRPHQRVGLLAGGLQARYHDVPSCVAVDRPCFHGWKCEE